jgi:hypothetical protein
MMLIEYVILGTVTVFWVLSPASAHALLGTLAVFLGTFASIGARTFG